MRNRCLLDDSKCKPLYVYSGITSRSEGDGRAGDPHQVQMLKPGTIVADKYRLERVLGRGGMGTVIEARHVQLGLPFALKFLHRSIADNATVPERFLREARAAAVLGSEHVCRVFDVGTFEDMPFLVMELLEGTDLEWVLRRERRLSPRVACNYLIQACAGVADAHDAQIVHRDLKPGNLFLAKRPGRDSLIKVLDFGIAKAPQETDPGLTGTDIVLGSPAYMSFEQLRSSRMVDSRSDIWSLGVILFELVSGRRPFLGEGIADLALRIAMEPVPQLPDGPAALDTVIARCLARDPAERYQDVGELALDLAPYASDPERRLARSLVRASRSAAALPAASASVTLIDPLPDRLETPPARSVELRAADPASEANTTLQALQSSVAIEQQPPARRRWLGPVLLAATIAGGISLGVLATRGEDEGSELEAAALPQSEPAAIAPAQPPPPPPPAADPIPEPDPAPTITLRFALEPAGAAVELDDVFVTARQIRVRRDDAPHRVRITAPGFTAYESQVRFDESQKLTVRLVRAAAAFRPVGPPPAKSRSKSTSAVTSRIESTSPYQP
jgi:serine/threonine-protein kinase